MYNMMYTYQNPTTTNSMYSATSQASTCLPSFPNMQYQQQTPNMNMLPQGTMAMNQFQADPVNKAVVDNIMGKNSIKRPQVRCHDCNLDFTSQIVLDAHLQGARHAKQIRSKTIRATLEQTNIAFTEDEVTNGLKCNPCNVLLNSIQQLQTHLNGNRHKKKLAKGDWCGKEIVSKNNTSQATFTPQPVANSNLLTCGPCNKFFNSPSQLNVHLASQKHLDKINNTSSKNSKKKRFFPYWRKDQTVASSQMGGTAPMATPALANSFVSAGYQQYGY